MNGLRITVSVFGRFHAFDLAQQLHQARVLERLITSYPKYFAVRWELPPDKLVSLLSLELLARGHAMLPRTAACETDALFWLCKSFDQAAAKHLSRKSNLFVGWSSYSLATIRRAKAWGMKTVVDRGGSHIGFQRELLQEEYARWGRRLSDPSEGVCARELQEYAEADRVAVPSQYVKRTFLARGVASEKLLYLSYGVSLEEFYPVAKEDAVFRVIHCGALSLQKGVPYLLQAFHELNLLGAELWLVGTPRHELRPILARYRSQKIVLKGTHPQSKLRWFYSQCSVFCLASVDDGFGMVIPQAMACGLPVIHTTNTGGRDIIDEGVEGFEVPIRDVTAIKEKLLYLYENPEACREMGYRARQRAVTALSWMQYGQRALAAYRDVVEGA